VLDQTQEAPRVVRDYLATLDEATWGAARMLAADLPLKIIDMARGTCASVTSRIVTAADLGQNPPSAIPRSTRPKRRNRRSAARATRSR